MRRFDSDSSTVRRKQNFSDTGGTQEQRNSELEFMIQLSNQLNAQREKIQTLEKQIEEDYDKKSQLIESMARLTSLTFYIQIFLPIVIIVGACIIFWHIGTNSVLIKVVYGFISLTGLSFIIQAIRLPSKLKDIERDINEIKNKINKYQ